MRAAKSRADIVPQCGKGDFAQIAGNRQGLQPKALARNQIGLHAIHRADKENLCVRLPVTQQLCHGQRRIDMSSRAAAGKDHPQSAALLNSDSAKYFAKY